MDALSEILSAYAAEDSLPMHMPGHKRRSLHTPALPWALDLTEIDGFDDLHDPGGVLAASMSAAAALWGSGDAFYLVNGSTGGILAALHAALPRGSTLLLARNCHKSAYHAVELLGLDPVYLQPPIDPSTGLSGSLPPAAVAAALAARPEAKALFLTSPTYDGVLSDLPALAALCHSHGIPLIVDEAHGAHLGFGGFPSGAVAAGADAAVQSLHKTLPSLTQTALLHRQGGLIAKEALARSLNIFQTSSPSYPLMASLDGCVRLMAEQGGALCRDWLAALKTFDAAIRPLARLAVLCHGGDLPSNHPAFFAHDPSKLVISTRGTNLTGPELMVRLRAEFHIELEMAGADFATAMTGLGDGPDSLARLAEALLTVDSALSPAAPPPRPVLPPPRPVLPIWQALERPQTALPLALCGGRVSAQYLWAYPPGIPLLTPGEQISPALLSALRGLEDAGVPLKSPAPPGSLLVCGETP